MTGRSQVLLMRVALAVRGLWPDRKPLRRTFDRVEAGVVAGLAVAFLAGTPMAAIAAWHFAYGVGARAAHAQQAAWHQVPAVPLANLSSSALDQTQEPARWVAPRTEPQWTRQC